MNAIATGDILASLWGYEQTNIDFYEVTRTSTASVWLRPIRAQKTPDALDMQYMATPCPGDYTGPEFRRKRDERLIRIDSCSFARRWKGEPLRGTSYA